MGYRSNLKLITTKEGWEKISRAVKQAEPDNHEYITSEKHVEELRDGYILWSLYDVKWYEDMFPEVQAFMKTLDELSKENIPYQYARTGEDYNDVEYDPNWVDGKFNMPYLEIVQDIVVND